ncbi:beta-propeller fold lactonase family protein [Nostoc sp. FACHB-152]|uniref:bifunctional YncE family protein/alkaline phosphatase family protein n=1 Tax=unclassified Nostoc TaxID=2593658 RepID=UPI00168452AD|nr:MULTISPECIES: beta-propeller fold lactonase family protein [unclassified Nostoc]MBD2447790.1 beta-propeller fold lactonase family protein [Nostoc sp. FACHB-152]MBD2467081.1 beta-propeller fold lactonase family protein [Nostoc sp. FACHB-145]
MFNFKRKRYLLLSLLVAVAIAASSVQIVTAQLANSRVGELPEGGALLPTGQIITPAAAPGSTFARLATGLRADNNADAAEAVTTALSPDGQTLLVLTSGYNQNFRDQNTGADLTYPVLDPATGQPTSTTTRKAEWVFVFDVSSGKLVKRQQINIPNTYNGLAWAKDGSRFYVSGGIDDRVYVYTANGSQFVPDAPFILLGHNPNQTAPFPTYNGGLLKDTPANAAATGAVVAGLAVSQDGNTLVAANFENDSISLVNTANRQVTQEIKFVKPGDKIATGEFPFDVAIKNTNSAAGKVFVSSQRDDEVVAVDIASGTITRIPVGSQPNNIQLSADQKKLYVANGNSDTISVIDTNSNSVVQTISLSRPKDKYKGANPNSIALSPDGRTLYTTLGGENAVAVVDLRSGQVAGRIPTGWYPNSVSVSQDGKKLFVVNAKSNSGPNPSQSRTTPAGEARNTTFRNEYNWALEKAGIAVIPVPNGSTLASLTRQVDRNNGFDNRRPDRTMRFLQGKIKHVIYVLKENRTYDQVLGDLPIGNGDPALTLLPEPISPNHHKLALDFVTFDNFYDSGESSGVGWNWSTYGRTTDYTEKTQSVLYGNAGFNGLTYDYEGTNRNINIALPQTNSNPSQFNARVTGVLDPSGQSSILPGTKDVNAPIGDGELSANAVGGYLWDAALRAGKTVRNYGFYTDGNYSTSQADATKPDPTNPLYIPISPTPAADNIQQAVAAKNVLLDKTDNYFRGYDMKNSDVYLYNEFVRDIDKYLANNTLPNLTMVRLPHDHFGDFNNAVAGLNTVPLQMADNDYAVGLLVEKISKSPVWKETAIVILEDDCQNGPDHVDSHRSVAYIISPYTKRKALVSTNYNTVSIVRTMEDLLGIGYLGMNDANAKPMSDAFTREPNFTPYTAVVPGNLCTAPVDPNLVPACKDPNVQKTAALPSLHNKEWWAQATKDFYFEVEDKLDPEKFNRVLWSGIKGENIPYPTERSHADLRQNRAQLLAKSESISTQPH